MFSTCILVLVSKFPGRKFCLPHVSAWTMFSANTLDLELHCFNYLHLYKNERGRGVA